MDFNADLGESFGLWRRGADEALMAVISSANVACGFHAGDPGVMRATLETARGRGVAVGAHPGLPDLLGFGRRAMAVSPREVRDYVLYQVGALDAFARATGLRLHHVKPHGALYTMALDDARLSRAVVEAVAEYDQRLPIYTLAGSETWVAAEAAGIRAVPEFFADRPLRADGTVIMFDWEPHLEPTPEKVAARVRGLLTEGVVESVEGRPVRVQAETICVHADTPGAAEIGPAVRAAVTSAGWRVSSELLAGAPG
ncbi:MAG TPA: 5-oxoprolinase subunit PxpA [Candidatus Dormibacteraeota bacterium]|nr:5-oxoprolinase subunit PxpA [Candidatus Dormibacteraeota bacterium]